MIGNEAARCRFGRGGSEDVWFFISQHRKNSARGKVIDKK